ncbi:hypothetical protein BZG36_02257 [Bifiguratus adelaidae]|uniref:PPM-type phosphatase domain-containing protein n=1 Tax=Bifiguratus adelaidae TaxID=1938954 RepID=A0A261Y1K0_9FUNG|nr:hypothetical protein BZG36_02257 [Bifiguratus adelaidae]
MARYPLSGVKVLEIAGLAPAPFAGMVLADFGAEVIRIDRLSGGGNDVLARHKKSISLDLKSREGRDLFIRLVKQVDVVIEPFRAGVMEKLGLGPDVLLKENEKLVYARMTGWGQRGPMANVAGHDINYIAMSGILHSLGRKGEKPSFPINLFGDFAGGGFMCAFGIIMALLERTKSGKGQVIDAAMVQGASYLSSFVYNMKKHGLMLTEERGTNLLDGGAPFYEVYETKDGKFMAVGALEPQFYQLLVKGLGFQEDELPSQMDMSGWPEMRKAFTDRFKSKTQDEWTSVFLHIDACVTPILDFDYGSEHEKTFKLAPPPSPAPLLSRTPAKPVPTDDDADMLDAGKHTRSVLKDFGLRDEEIDRLEQSRVITNFSRLDLSIDRALHHVTSDTDTTELTTMGKHIPDQTFLLQDPLMSQLVNTIMKDGKKARAQRLVSDALLDIRLKTNSDPYTVLSHAITEASPLIKLTSARKGSKVVQVPTPLQERQRRRRAIVWILEAAAKRNEKKFPERLSAEILAIINGGSSVLAKKQQLHKSALANRANAQMAILHVVTHRRKHLLFLFIVAIFTVATWVNLYGTPSASSLPLDDYEVDYDADKPDLNFYKDHRELLDRGYVYNYTGIGDETEDDNTIEGSDKNMLWQDEEKYLAFLPHSGFHNQRLSLINAIMVAKWLNRTLIVPPVNLGVGTFWKNYTDLVEHLEYCIPLVEEKLRREARTHEREQTPSYCFDYRRYTPMPFDQILDFTVLKKIGVRYISRDDMSRKWFETHLDIPQDERNKSLVHVYEDYDRYEYRIYDHRRNQEDLGLYQTRLDVEDMKKRPEKLLHFGSMFGSWRLAISRPNNHRLVQRLREELALNYPVATRAADSIINRLGGDGHYVGIHVRAGDGMFVEHIQETITNIKAKLVEFTMSEENFLSDGHEHALASNASNVNRIIDRIKAMSPDRAWKDLLGECLKYSHSGGRLTTIFMATDSKDPRKNRKLKDLYDTFPCVFTLNDFKVERWSVNVKHPNDITMMAKMLWPMVDAIVASNGMAFIGTKDSTFSSSIDVSAYVRPLSEEDERNHLKSRFRLARAHKSVQKITHEAAQDMLREHETSLSSAQFLRTSLGADPSASIIARFDNNSLPSNNPIEDDHSEHAVIVGATQEATPLLFGIFDGHSGWNCSQKVSAELSAYVAKHIFEDANAGKDAKTLPSSAERIVESIQKAFLILDDTIVNRNVQPYLDSSHSVSTVSTAALVTALAGSCGLLAYIDNRDLYVACVGDSRAVLGSRDSVTGRWTANALTEDQTGRNKTEVTRMQKEHPGEEDTVIQRGRVLGGLEPTRAFGDARYKWSAAAQEAVFAKYFPGKPLIPKNYQSPPYVMAKPEVTHHEITEEDKFLVLATDGLWDKLSNDDVVRLVGEFLDAHGDIDLKNGRVLNFSGKPLSKPTKAQAVGEAVEDNSSAKMPHTPDSRPSSSFILKDTNAATHLIRNALGGADEDMLCATLSIPPPMSRRYRDDITVTVMFFNADANAKEL